MSIYKRIFRHVNEYSPINILSDDLNDYWETNPFTFTPIDYSHPNTFNLPKRLFTNDCSPVVRAITYERILSYCSTPTPVYNRVARNSSTVPFVSVCLCLSTCLYVFFYVSLCTLLFWRPIPNACNAALLLASAAYRRDRERSDNNKH